LCHGNEFEQVDGKVRDLPELAILKCRNCGLIFLESFDHIEETYYADSKMHHDPKGARGRIEYEMDDIRRFEYCKALIGNKKIIDFGCGYGNFIFKAKDIASETIGIEADRTILAYLKNKGYTVYPDLNHIEESERFDVITMFHVLEHLPDPRKILSRFKSCLNKEGKIIIEVPNSEDALLTLYNNKGFSEFFWSCHLYLFSAQTLRTLCVSAGFIIFCRYNDALFPTTCTGLPKINLGGI
jgi:2-polyprenyl-3-methyl-5-hydroxy-6-metoxy-1,4-benzoquinol methylase